MVFVKKYCLLAVEFLLHAEERAIWTVNKALPEICTVAAGHVGAGVLSLLFGCGQHVM